MIRFRTVLVASDFGEASESALTYGRELARLLGADLHILHVVEEVGDTVARAIGSEGYIPDSSGFRRRAEDAARHQLESSLTREGQRLLHARPVVRTSSTPALAIVWYAKEAGIDLIVMGTHGRKGLAHLVMGSVAERVVQTAPCPVLTVKRQEPEFAQAHGPHAAMAGAHGAPTDVGLSPL